MVEPLSFSRFDKIKGGFLGLAMGDALGVPHEFGSREFKYTGKLEHKFTLRQKFQPPKTLAVGQYSDDTEMALTLARSMIESSTKSIIEQKKYDLKTVAITYFEWNNSGTPMRGKNTRELFNGKPYVSDPSGYSRFVNSWEKKYQISFSSMWTAKNDVTEASQSNGSLMRSFPLACISDGKEFYSAFCSDVWITNPSRFTLNIEFLYLTAIRLAIDGKDAKTIYLSIRDLVPKLDLEDKDKKIIWLIFDEKDDPIAKTKLVTELNGKGKAKGWCLYGLYCAMKCLWFLTQEKSPTSGKESLNLSGESILDKKLTYSDLMKWVIDNHPGSDTDTNAAIAGALIGTIFGFEKLNVDPLFKYNLPVLIKSTSGEITDVPRGKKYQIVDIDDIVLALSNM